MCQCVIRTIPVFLSYSFVTLTDFELFSWLFLLVLVLVFDSFCLTLKNVVVLVA